MDPLSHAVFGSSLTQLISDREHRKWALLVGFGAGMAPDLDVLIRSPEDPLLFLEFHRQFTHSLFFIPFGALIVASFFWIFLRSKIGWKKLYLYSLASIGLHGLLDAATTYGTQLLWPFTNERFGWGLISIIDPLFTGVLLVGLILHFFTGKRMIVAATFSFACLYLVHGFIQKSKVEGLVYQLASQRGETVKRLEVKPGFANQILWKAIYETETEYVFDGFRKTWLSEKHYPGDRIKIFDPLADLPELKPDSQLAEDIRRFQWFSDGWVAPVTENANILGDIRFSDLPHQAKPLWGISVDLTQQDKHVDFIQLRTNTRENWENLKRMLRGEDIQ
jgi:inner membrane protein